MPLFKREATDRQEPQRPEPRSVGGTVIAHGCVIRGNISSASPLRIEGEVLASTIEADEMTVERDGRVEGAVTARKLRVDGTIHGGVQCSERIEISSTGEVVGDVDSPRLIISEGGTLRGKTQMSGSPGTANSLEPERSDVREGDKR